MEKNVPTPSSSSSSVPGLSKRIMWVNAKQSLITTTQVYEYFISHHMAKAFESLFGSVTCLAVSLYRLHTPDTHKALLISNPVIFDYLENRVDTLHMKSLLHLGEIDILRHFSSNTFLYSNYNSFTTCMHIQ